MSFFHLFTFSHHSEFTVQVQQLDNGCGFKFGTIDTCGLLSIIIQVKVIESGAFYLRASIHD